MFYIDSYIIHVEKQLYTYSNLEQSIQHFIPTTDTVLTINSIIPSYEHL